jgi:hypothetical protein
LLLFKKAKTGFIYLDAQPISADKILNSFCVEKDWFYKEGWREQAL